MTGDGEGEGDEKRPEPAGPLSFETDEERWAHRRDPDLDAGDEKPTGAVPRPRSSPYSWLFGVFVVIVLAYITLNTARNVGGGRRGIAVGQTLPAFATPLALSKLDGDANVASKVAHGQHGKLAACDVHGRDVFNVCELGAEAPLVLAFVATGAPACTRQLDGMEHVSRRFPGVRFAAVAARTDRGGLQKLIRRHRWTFPVGYDRDGAAFAVYGVVDCPTLAFSYPGRIAMRTTVKRLSDAQLQAAVGGLVAGSKRRGWKPPARP